MKSGPYQLLVQPRCNQAYEKIIRELVARGVSRTKFKQAIGGIKAECDLGRLPSGSVLLRNENGLPVYGVTVHGYRVHFKVDENLLSIEIVDIEEP